MLPTRPFRAVRSLAIAGLSSEIRVEANRRALSSISGYNGVAIKLCLFAATALPLLLGCCCPITPPEPGSSKLQTESIDSSPPKSDAEVKKAEKEAERAVREAEGTVWAYETEDEDMGRGKVRYARVRSLNEIEFDFPYAEPQRAILMLRRHPKHGNDVILSIERGQFLAGLDGTDVAVKFDNESPRQFHAVEPADHSTTHLFIRGFDRFLAKAKKAKRLKIEAEFYQEGNRVFEFDVSGLKF